MIRTLFSLLLVACLGASVTLAGEFENTDFNNDQNIDFDNDGTVSIEEASKQIVAEVVVRLKEESVTREILIQGFDYPADNTMTGGGGLRAQIALEFGKNGYTIKDKKAPLTLEGKFFPKLDPNASRIILQVKYELSDDRGQEYLRTKKDVVYEKTNQETLIPPAEKNDEGYVVSPVIVDKVSDVAAVTNRVGKFDKPFHEKAGDSSDKAAGVFVDNGVVFDSAKCQLGIALVKAPKPAGDRPPGEDDYKSVPAAFDENGDVFAPVGLGEVYGIQLINKSDQRVAARILVDGISIMHFSEERKQRNDFWVVEPNSSYVIYGWHKNKDSVHSFLVDKLSANDGEALLGTTGIGGIYVDFYGFYSTSQEMPEKERGKKGTVKGPVQNRASEIIHGFVSPTMISAVAVRYERKAIGK